MSDRFPLLLERTGTRCGDSGGFIVGYQAITLTTRPGWFRITGKPDKGI
jgi:hypothetical protein